MDGVAVVVLVVVASGKHGSDGDLVVPGTPATTSPPGAHSVMVHSNGCGQNRGLTHPHGAPVVVVPVVVEVVLPPGSIIEKGRLMTVSPRPQFWQPYVDP